jgi:DNA-binding NtrC family response regulator
MPTIRLDEQATALLLKYRWGGNIRQLRNVAEQISVLEKTRSISFQTLRGYLKDVGSNLPAVIETKKKESDFSNERELLYKVLFDMQRDLNDVKKLTLELMKSGNNTKVQEEHSTIINKMHDDTSQSSEDALATLVDDRIPTHSENVEVLNISESIPETYSSNQENSDNYTYVEDIEEEENLSIQEKELELIKKSLEKYKGKRKDAAEELGISERTLYRKIKQYNL